MKLISIICIIFFFSCDNSKQTSVEFPIINLVPFSSSKMEFENNNVSYIINSTKDNGPISLRLSWNQIKRNDLSKINVYRINNSQAELIDEIFDISKQSLTINEGLEYETNMQFQLTVTHEDGEESPLSKSNKVSVNITHGDIDNYNYVYEVDSLKELQLFWSISGNGSPLNNPIINVEALRNNLLDSISLTVKYKKEEIETFSKILSVIGSYRDFGEEIIDQGNEILYKINFNDLNAKMSSFTVKTILKDNIYFANTSLTSPISNIFKKVGFYQIYFYFYKKQNGRNYIFKSSTTQTFKFPK